MRSNNYYLYEKMGYNKTGVSKMLNGNTTLLFFIERFVNENILLS